MRAALFMAAGLACAGSLSAQISTSLNELPDGTAEIRIRNDSSVSLVAFAIRVKYRNLISTNGAPILLYADPVIDSFPEMANPSGKRVAGSPVLPGREFTMLPELMVARSPISGRPVFEEPMAAGFLRTARRRGMPRCFRA